MLLNSPPHALGEKFGRLILGRACVGGQRRAAQVLPILSRAASPPAQPNVLRLVRRLPTEVTRERTARPANWGPLALERKGPVHPALGKQSPRPVGQRFGRQSPCLQWYTPKYPNQLRNILVLRTAVPAWYFGGGIRPPVTAFTFIPTGAVYCLGIRQPRKRRRPSASSWRTRTAWLASSS